MSVGENASGAKDIDNIWPSLKKAGFETVDMAFPKPGGDGHEVYFSGTQYARIWYQSGQYNDEVKSGPHDIGSWWPSLRQAGLY